MTYVSKGENMDNKKIADYVDKFNRNDEETVKQKIDNAHALKWMLEQIPYFECSDSILEETYYFRWWVYRKHIKETPEGYIITEFHPDVDWAGPYNSINCASGHHLAEGRWLKNGSLYLEDYIRFWLKGSGNQYSYSSWLAEAVYEYCTVRGDYSYGIRLLDDLAEFYEHVEETNMTRYGLFWSYDDRDAMEMSVSGSGLRPTLNSYMYGNAMAIARLAKRAGRRGLQEKFEQKADALKSKIQELLWDDKDGYYKVIPQQSKEDDIVDFSIHSIPADRNVKELIGYIPWAFHADGEETDRAWKYLTEEDYFYTKYGLTTAEKNHVGYMKPCATHECLWNGPIWPFATTQALNSRITYFQNQEIQGDVLFMTLLTDYAGSHYRINEQGKRINWLDENMDPDTGRWLSRDILKSWGWPKGKGGYERGKDYNHSAFCDLVLRGVAGISLEEDNVTVNPLLPDGMWDYFMAENVPFKNHSWTICYDKKGERYGNGKGFFIYMDGQLVHKDETISKWSSKIDKLDR